MPSFIASIKNTELTDTDMDLIIDVLNDYIENFDPEHEAAIGVANPDDRYKHLEILYGRMIGIDFTNDEPPVHHTDCVCDWCQMNRGEL